MAQKRMKIVLKERIDNVEGDIGDEVEVKAGFGRHLVERTRQAVRANDKKAVEAIQSKLSDLKGADNEKRVNARSAQIRIDGLTLTFVRQANPQTGTLYGSVQPRDIANAVNEQVQGADVTANQIKPSEAFRDLVRGEEVIVQLHPEIAATVKINIAASPDEADEIKGDHEYVVFDEGGRKALDRAIVVLIRPEHSTGSSDDDFEFDISELFESLDLALEEENGPNRDLSLQGKIAEAITLAGMRANSDDIELDYNLKDYSDDGVYKCGLYFGPLRQTIFVVKAATTSKAEKLIDQAKQDMASHRAMIAEVSDENTL